MLSSEASYSLLDTRSGDTEYCPSLTWKTRIYGFAICLGLAWITGVLSGIFIAFVVTGSLAPFAVLYSVSNILALASTFFLMGPKNQLKKMFKPVRLWACIAYLLFIGLTLFAALYLRNSGLCMLFAFLQYCALFWYTLSYIPGARACFLACCKKTTGLGNES